MLITTYGTLAISRVGLQLVSSNIQRQKKFKRVVRPRATLVIAVYNEPIDIFKASMESIAKADYPNLEVIIVNDGTKARYGIKKEVLRHGFKYVYQRNAGKREAMYNAFSKMSKDSKIVFTGDSDTVYDKRAFTELAKTLLSNKKIGAATGEVAVLNHDENFQTKLIGMRYHVAFAQERAAMGLFGAVNCVSGPLGAYRRDVIDDIKDEFVNQQFLGRKCTYGDDRHLSNLVLGRGHKISYANKATCWTYAPNKFWVLIKQQTRWSKSFWRESLWQLKALPRQGFYLSYDLIISTVLPIILLSSVAAHIYGAIDGNAWYLAALMLTIMIMTTIRIAQPAVEKKQPEYFYFVAYAFLYFSFLLPMKFWALVTIADGKWGTR